jgi:hypothetical protein
VVAPLDYSVELFGSVLASEVDGSRDPVLCAFVVFSLLNKHLGRGLSVIRGPMKPRRHQGANLWASTWEPATPFYRTVAREAILRWAEGDFDEPTDFFQPSAFRSLEQAVVAAARRVNMKLYLDYKGWLFYGRK